MTQAEVLTLCEQSGAYLRGHFRLTSGLHSPEYVQCALVLAHPPIAARLGEALAAVCPGRPVDFVAAPALGGLIIGHEVARALGCRFLFTERDREGRMALRRGFTVRPGEKGVVIEDVITTGGSTRETIEVMEEAGAIIAGVGSIIDRSGGAVDLGRPRVALATLQVVSYPPEACPLCAAGQPLVKPGSRQV
ncbi:MAG: orotate phosphoribosyltransferase [Acidobacteria bacterium]|nr:orotate phosphoribosyltransferase [Acidobacteriota bacterium]